MPTAADYIKDPTGNWVLRTSGNAGQSTPLLQSLAEQNKNSLKIYWVKDIGPEPEAGEDSPGLWGNFIISGSIHLLSGVAGVGKTTLSYDIAVDGCRGDTLVERGKFPKQGETSTAGGSTLLRISPNSRNC